MEFDLVSAAVGAVLGLAFGVAATYFAMVARMGAAVHQQAQRIASRVIADPSLANKLDASLLLLPPVAAKPSGEGVRLLAILQQEARLLDFLQEEIAAYDDAAIGAAVHNIHQKSKKVLADHLTLKPILAGEEGTSVTVPAGFDPSAIRVIGNVVGSPPYKGTLTHAGWRAQSVTLPKLPESADAMVVMPAEVEIE